MPNTGADMKRLQLSAGQKKILMEIEEPGKNLYSQFYAQTNNMNFRLWADEVKLLFGWFDYINSALLNGWGYVRTYGNVTPLITVLEYGGDGTDNTFVISIPFSWERKLKVEMECVGAAAARWGSLQILYERPTPQPLDIQEPEVIKDPQM